MLQLTKKLIKGESISLVNNLIYINNGKVETTTYAVPIPMDELPNPDFDDLNFKNYFAPEFALPIITSRGCYWGNCKFCSLHKSSKIYNQKSANLIAEDLGKLVKKYNTNIVLFFDTVMKPNNMLDMADEIIKKKINIYWTCVTKFESVFTKENSKKLYKSGCRMLEFEYESCDKKTHKFMDTGIDLKTTENYLKNTASAGIINTICVLYGLPGENFSDYVRTNDMIISKKETIHSVITFTYNLTRDSILWIRY
ncbi:MAG: radical SAM protein [Clostridiales bacterium]